MRTLAAIVFASLFFLSTEANAGGPPGDTFTAGEQYVIKTILCDNADYAESILIAQVEAGPMAARQQLRNLNRARNDVNEPICALGEYPVTMVGNASVFERVPGVDGQPHTIYVVYVTIGDTPFAILSSYPVSEPGQGV